MNQRIRHGLALFGMAAVLMVAGAAAAQQSTAEAAQQRYQKATKGGGSKDFASSMQNDDPDARLAGLNALTDLSDGQSVDYLLQALGDGDMRVRAKAIDSCGNLRATAATPVLVQQLFLRETTPPVRQRVIAALGKIGDARATKPIIEILEHDLDVPTRGTAIFALGDIGDSESLVVLDEISRTDENPTLQRLAREAAHKVRYAQAAKANAAEQPQNTFLHPAPPQR
jgi:HEAT repeat protein